MNSKEIDSLEINETVYCLERAVQIIKNPIANIKSRNELAIEFIEEALYYLYSQINELERC